MEISPYCGSPKDLPIYLDYQATTPCEREVLIEMEPYWNENWGNPSNRHNRPGLTAAAVVSLARERLASCLQIASERLIFTSGGTEANNLALLGHLRAKHNQSNKPGHLITVSTEHHSVLGPLRKLQREGFRLKELTPSSDGVITTNQLINAFESDTQLVSVMMANNEIGVIQPLVELSRICKERGAIFHCDAVQGLGNLPINPDALGIDLMSISSHKIYGPKGIGALIIKKGLPISPLQWGGGQEQGIRPGTIPVPLVVGFAKAAELATEILPSQQLKLQNLRDELLRILKTNLPNIIVNGSMKNRLAHNLNITITGVNGKQLQSKLKSVISCSSGSACSQGSPSHVLKALGRTSHEAESSIRLSLGKDTSMEDIQKAAKAIINVVKDLKV